MFASVIVAMPAAIRRMGAHLKAFALLEDVDPAALSALPSPRSHRTARTASTTDPVFATAPQVLPRAVTPTSQAAARSTGGAVHTGLPRATPAASHVHRRPPRTRVARTTSRRTGSVPARPQPCVTPLATPARGPAELRTTRPLRRGAAH